MNRLTTENRARILTVLSEGMGINAACRATGASKNTVLKLIADAGRACALYQDRTMRNLSCKRIQCDEIWSFVGRKQKCAPADAVPAKGLGDCYTFTAFDPDTKLMPCWLVGVRTVACTNDFVEDLTSRLAGRVQITTDGLSTYPNAIDKAFGRNVDYGILNKIYENEKGLKEAKRRYSPANLTSTTKLIGCGKPDTAHVTTSHVERANVSMQMGMRRFTRLTNAFSKKLENHMHAISFYFMVYNFVKVHSSVRCSPAIAAGITDTLWSIEAIVMMADTMRDEVVTDSAAD